MAKKTKRSSGSPKPKNPALYARVKAEAKRTKGDLILLVDLEK